MSLENKLSVMVATHIVNATHNPYLNNDMIIKTIRSSHDRMGLNGVVYYVYIDASMKRKFPKLYKEYRSILSSRFESELSDINVILLEETRELLRGNWMHMIENCTTPYFLFLEHDWEFIKDIPMDNIISKMDTHDNLSYIRFPYTKLGPGEHKHWDEVNGGLFEKESDIDLPLTRIAFYSGNPHIVKLSKCKDFYLPEHTQHWETQPSKGTSHLEKELADVALKHIKSVGKKEAHKLWGCFLYGTWDGFDPVVKHLGDWCRKR